MHVIITVVGLLFSFNYIYVQNYLFIGIRRISVY